MPRSAKLLGAAVLALAAAPSAALAAWSGPTTVSSLTPGDHAAQAAFGGSVLTGEFDATFGLARRSGDTFARAVPLFSPAQFEQTWDASLAGDGTAIVLTIRRHRPAQRIRATVIAPDGTASATRTISPRLRSASQPTLDIAPDGTAVAAWVWHSADGWVAQAAIRRPGQPRFDAPQTLSPGFAKNRPWLTVAAGDGGRGVVTWQIGGSFQLPEAPLHVRTAGADSAFGADQQLGDAGGLADVALAVSHDGAVQVAYLDEHFSGHEGPSKLHVAQGTAGAPLSDAAVLSTGGKGTSSGPQVAAAFSADGTATVAWAKPGADYEQGGDLEVYTRAPGGGFGAAQTLARDAQGVVMAGGPEGSAVLAWMHETSTSRDVHWTTHAAVRGAGAFGPDETISDTSRNGPWPSVAMTPSGDAIAAWVTNTDGSGGGPAAAAVDHVLGG